jgi:hypothetical protein
VFRNEQAERHGEQNTAEAERKWEDWCRPELPELDYDSFTTKPDRDQRQKNRSG